MLRTIFTSIIVYFCSQFMCVGNVNLLPKRREMLFYNFLAVFCISTFFNIFFYDIRISFLIVITLFYLLSLTNRYKIPIEEVIRAQKHLEEYEKELDEIISRKEALK